MTTLPPQLEAIRVKINERRKSLEQVRSFNVRRLNTDLKKITKQEIDFTKKLFEQIVPIKLVWNDDVAKRMRDMVPFTVELTKEDMEEETSSDLVDTPAVKSSEEAV